MTNFQKKILGEILDWLRNITHLSKTEITDNEWHRYANRSARGRWEFPEIDGSRQQLNHEIWSYLNDIGLTTERGKEWTEKRWRDFRNSINPVEFQEWLDDEGDWKPEFGEFSKSGLLASLMDYGERVRRKETQDLYERSKIDSQKRGRKRKRNSDLLASVTIVPGGTNPDDKIRKELVAGMTAMNIRPQKWILDMIDRK